MVKLHSYLRIALLIAFMASALSPIAVHAATPFPYGNGTATTPGSGLGNTPPQDNPGLGISAGLKSLETKISEDTSGIIKEDSLKKLVNDWTSFFLQYYMVVAVLLVIYLGVRLVMSQGSEEERGKTKQAFINLAIGTAIIFLSYVIVNQVVSIVSPDAQGQTATQILNNRRPPGAANTAGTIRANPPTTTP